MVCKSQCRSSAPLVSLMELLEFYAFLFCRISGVFNQVSAMVQHGSGVEDWVWREACTDLGRIGEECKRLGFHAALDKFEEIERMNNICITESKPFNEQWMAGEIKELHKRILAEMKNRIFFILSDGQKDFWDKNPFPDEVRASFPSATEDMIEAQRCFALARYTGSVFHLNRIVEAGLKALANDVGVKLRHDWGAQLREIQTELEKRYKAAGSRTPDEQFYSSVASQIGHMKNAWRNPTMHIEARYNYDLAHDIFNAVTAFMRAISVRLKE